jgi:hypothetical protein
MAVKLTERAPRVRCYACGSSRITQVCHHCGRAGCGRHLHRPPALAGRLFGREGRALGLDKLPSYHCDDCGHPGTRAGLATVAAGVLVALAGLVAASLDPLPGLALVVLGVALAGGADLYVRHLGGRARACLPLLVLPKIDDLRVRERLRARITLGPDGRYETRVGPADGELAADLTFGRPDRDRLRRYLGHDAPPDADVEFSAGFLVLRGRAGLDMSGEFPGPVIYLNGRTADHPVFRAGDHQISSPWKIVLPYQLLDKVPDVPGDSGAGPVWITPSLVARSDHRGLGLEIQWAELGPPEAPLVLDRVESLRLWVPVSWGQLEHVGERATVGTPRHAAQGGQYLRSIEWRHLSPTDQQRQQRRLTLTLRFEERIDLTHALLGRLDIDFKGALSGLEGMQAFTPLGARRGHVPGGGIETRVTAEFELSLASLRYQAIRLVPDALTGSGEDARQPDEFHGVLPNDETAIELTNAMSDDGYYVKRVIESPPRCGDRANIVQRHWDIAGRRYDGVYPIDVQLILTGEEFHHGDGPADGMTKVRITAQGACADSDMSDRVEQEWAALRKLTAKALGGVSARAQPRQILPPLTAAPVGPDLDQRVSAGRNHRLLRRLGMLDEALLERRITAERYAEMRARAETELGGRGPGRPESGGGS